MIEQKPQAYPTTESLRLLWKYFNFLCSKNSAFSIRK